MMKMAQMGHKLTCVDNKTLLYHTHNNDTEQFSPRFSI